MLVGNVDVVVVGGGFAGLACAHVAALRGLKTVVLERKDEPGAGVHTTGLLVKEVADEWDVPRSLTKKIRGVRLYAPSLQSVDLCSPGYYFLATDTPGLLRWWAQYAQQAGVELRCRSIYQGVQRQGSHFVMSHEGLRSRFLVGADGARSRVAEEFNLGRNRRFLIGVEAEYEGVRDLDPDRLHVFLDSELAPGYIAWVVPGFGITQIGLAGLTSNPARLERFIHKLKTLFNFDQAREVGRRGGLIPIGGPARPLGMENITLAGDAAGLVSPLTAGGIHTAVHYGRSAGLAICDYLDGGVEQPYQVLQRSIPSFFWKQWLRIGLDLRPPNHLYDWLLGSRTLQALAQAVFFHHRGVLSLHAWRDFIRGDSHLQDGSIAEPEYVHSDR